VQAMDGLPKSKTQVFDFVSKGKTALFSLRHEKLQGCSFSSNYNWP
jgi:hypothetical protein